MIIPVSNAGSVLLESEVLRERTWEEAGAGEENRTESGWVQLQGKIADGVSLVSSCSVRGFSCNGRCPLFWVWGQPCFWLRDGDGGKQMEDYSWPNCLCPANTAPSAERGSWRLSPPKQKPEFSSAAIVWIWLMHPSLTFTSYRTSQHLLIPNNRFAHHGRIIVIS